MTPGPNAAYQTNEKVLQEVFKGLTTGLQFTSDTRLGRPLGTFDRPRPSRAEVWRAGRSAHHVELSLTALRDLGVTLAREDVAPVERLGNSFDTALAHLATVDGPIFAGV